MPGPLPSWECNMQFSGLEAGSRKGTGTRNGRADVRFVRHPEPTPTGSLQAPIIQNEIFHHILRQLLRRPLSEPSHSVRVHPTAHGKDRIEVVEIHQALDRQFC